MKFRWSFIFGIIGGALMALLVLLFYVSTDKTSAYRWVNLVG